MGLLIAVVGSAVVEVMEVVEVVEVVLVVFVFVVYVETARPTQYLGGLGFDDVRLALLPDGLYVPEYPCSHSMADSDIHQV